jgi:steroid delta-isomerase-like uncharacterized protein
MIIDGQRAADRAVTAVLEYYRAFNAGDWAGMLSRLTDDVAHDINQGVRETGVPAFDRFLQRMARCYREELRDIVVMTSPDGARAAAEFVVHGTYLADDEGLPPARGQRYVLKAGAFFALVDGRISRVTNYYNLQEWLQQVRQG